jgi:carboxymethylenebutenolidase
MIKKLSIFSLLSLSILCFCFVICTQPTLAQKPTGLSAMTLTSFGKNNNSSSSDRNTQSIENKTVNYFGNTTGYLVYPSPSFSPSTQNNQSEKLPAVVMIHENKGLNNYIKDSANILAKHGYVVLAVDLFNGEVTSDQNRSRILTSMIRENPIFAIENMKSAVNYLGSLENVNSSRIASLGWCFGGGQSLQLAINSKDHPIPVDTIKQFQKSLNQTGITNEIYIYPGVGHAFANPSNTNYAAKETSDAWKKTLAFLDKYA